MDRLHFKRKQNIFTQFVNQAGKPVNFESVLANDNFSVKIKVNKNIQNTLGFNITGNEIILPVKSVWEKIVKSKEFKDWHKNVTDLNSKSKFENYLRKNIFINQFNNGKLHKKVNRSFGLPMIDNNFSGVRHQRKSNDNELVFQVKSKSELMKVRGISESEDGKIVGVLHPLITSNKLLQIESCTTKSLQSNNLIPLNLWKRVEIHKSLTIELCIKDGSLRMGVRVRGSLDDLKKHHIISKNIKSIYKLDRKIEINNESLQKLGLPKHRDNVILKLIGDTICFEYGSESKVSSQLQKIYLQAQL